MNEVTTPEQLDFSVDYKPTTITINNQDKLNQAINDYIAKYKGLVVTEESLADDKKTKQRLNALKKQLNDKRIEIHKNFDQPYINFKSTIDDMVSRIDDVVAPINDGINVFEEKQKQQRLAEVKALINEMAPNYKVEPDEIEIDQSWLTKSISKKKRLDGIAGAMTLKVQEKKRLAEGTAAVVNYAELLKIDAAGWIEQLKQGQDLSYLQEQMKHAAEEKANKAAYDAAIAKIKNAQLGNKTVNVDTGEVVAETKVLTLEITGTIDELWTVRHFLDDHGIEFKKIAMQ